MPKNTALKVSHNKSHTIILLLLWGSFELFTEYARKIYKYKVTNQWIEQALQSL